MPRLLPATATVPLAPLLLALVAALALLVATPVAAQSDWERINVLAGLQPPSNSIDDRPQRIDVGAKTYLLEALRAPVDRGIVRNAKVIYLDRFPSGFELFRDDMETFHFMVHQGGVLLLVCGGSTPQAVADNFNYLGTRFDFEFLADTGPGVIRPERPRQGPLGGDSWQCDRGIRPLRLGEGDWRVDYRLPTTGEPVAASLRIGQGIIYLVGTDELNRTSEGVEQSALTLVEWCRQEIRRLPTPLPGPAPPPAWMAQPSLPSEEERARLLASSDAKLLRERLAELALAHGEDPRPFLRPLAQDLAIPADRRRGLPGSRALRTLDDRLLNLSDFHGAPLVVDLGASWDPASRARWRDRARLLKAYPDGAFRCVIISLDKNPAELATAAAQDRLASPLVADGRGHFTPWLDFFGVADIPATIVLDKRGRVASVNPHPDDVERLLLQLLDEG